MYLNKPQFRQCMWEHGKERLLLGLGVSGYSVKTLQRHGHLSKKLNYERFSFCTLMRKGEHLMQRDRMRKA